MRRLDVLRRAARKVPKAAYWLMTPWRMPERLQFLRERAIRDARAQSLKLLFDEERSRQEALQLEGGGSSRCRP